MEYKVLYHIPHIYPYYTGGFLSYSLTLQGGVWIDTTLSRGIEKEYIYILQVVHQSVHHSPEVVYGLLHHFTEKKYLSFQMNRQTD